MRNMWKKLKNYPELLGIGAVCILVGIIFLYKLEARRGYVDPGIVTEDMARESTADGFKEPGESVRYMISALQKEDLDMGLRGFPIDEKILGINVGEELNSLGEFSTTLPTCRRNGKNLFRCPLLRSQKTIQRFFRAWKNSLPAGR